MTTSQEETMTADYRAEAVKLLAASSRHTDTGDATDQHIALARAGQGTIRALLAIHDEVRGLRADLRAWRDAPAPTESGLRATESDVDADPAPVEGSGSGRPAEPLSDERPTNQPPMTVDDIVTRAAEVLIEHTRTSIEACHCGWGKDPGTLGKSHAEHVARALVDAGLLVTAEAVNTAIKDRARSVLTAMQADPNHLRSQLRGLADRADEELP